MLKKKSGLLRVLLIPVLLLAGWIAWSFCTVPAQRATRDFPAPVSRYDFGKVLVVYYSLGGNTAEVAGRIRDMTNGELLEIETEKVYPSTPALYFVAGWELMNGKFPALKKGFEDFSSCDVIFVGSPVWWYTVSTPMLSFLSKADFGGKTVVPFSTEGGNYGDFFVRFAKEAHNANVVTGTNFSGVPKTDLSVLDQKISVWLENLKKELPRPVS